MYWVFGEEFRASFASLKDGLDEFFDDDGDKQMGASESKKSDNGDCDGDGDGDDDMGVSESKKMDKGDGDDDMPDSPPPEDEPMATPPKPKSGKKRKGISPLKLLFGKSK